MRKSLVAAVLVFALAALAGSTEAGKTRAAALQRVLLAPCCWSEPVATHGSEVALEMRAEINRLVAEGKSDREILDYYKSRYGMRILIEPDGARSFWMHLVPPIVILAGCGWVIFLIHRWIKRRPQPSAG